jgi:polysaccharide biosynthesis transport protein
MDTKLNENDFYFDDDSKEEEVNIDLKKYLQMLIKRKWIILIVFLLVTIPWVYNIQKQPPDYRASCMIRFRNLASGSQDVIDRSRIIELSRRSFAEDVVAQLGLTLQIDDELELLRQDVFDEFFTTNEPMSGLYVLRWANDSALTINRISGDREYKVFDGDIGFASALLQETESGFSFRFTKNFTNLPQEINFKINQFRGSVKYFQSRTRIRPQGQGLVLVEMADRNAVFVAKKVNMLADLYVKESKSWKRSNVENQKDAINKQLEFANEQLKEADDQLKEFKSRHKVSLNAETEESVGDLRQAEKQLERLEKHSRDLNTLLDKLDMYTSNPEEQNKVKYVYQQIAELETFSSNPNMGFLRKQLRDVEKELASSIFTPSHEKTVKLENELNSLYSQIKTEALSQKKDIQENFSIVTRRKNQLDYKISLLPAEEAALTELQRQLDAKEKIRADLLSQMQLAQLSEAVDTEIIDILDPALVPDAPTNADKNMKMIVGAVFGLILGLSVAFVLEFLDKAIKTVDDVKRYLKLQVLGTIPHIDFKDLSDYQDSEKIKQIDQQLVTYDYSPTPIGEAYRSLRTNLVYSKNTGKVQSFVVTSSAPGDGKSFTSANIAISMAQHKSNTLLIDGDLRRGVLHNTYGVSKEPGFTNYLTGMVGLQPVINETLIPNLSMISCGSLLPNPSELLGSHQMQRFLDEARRKFDVIIFDSPPLNAATDAIVLGTQVDALVLVVRSGVTNRDIAKQKLELFRNVPVKILGVVLNGTSTEFGHDGYSYYHY